VKALKTCLVLCVVMAAWAAMPAEASEEVASRAVPEGLSAADWAAIRAHLPGDVETSTPPRPEAYSGQIELTASDGLPGDRYGFAVAVFGDVAAVGAYLADIGGNAN